MIQIMYKRSDQFNMATDFQDGHQVLPWNTLKMTADSQIKRGGKTDMCA